MDSKAFFVLAPLAVAACSPAETAVPPEAPLVQVIAVAPGTAGIARYTGVIRARTESNLGFRVGGKISERLVDPGDHVRLGQPLMRLDRTDFTLALNGSPRLGRSGPGADDQSQGRR